jgi:hypothetical protein
MQHLDMALDNVHVVTVRVKRCIVGAHTVLVEMVCQLAEHASRRDSSSSSVRGFSCVVVAKLAFRQVRRQASALSGLLRTENEHQRKLCATLR